MLLRDGSNWLLDGRPLQNGDLVEVRVDRSADDNSWVPGVVTCDGEAIAFQGTADSDAGHHAADARMNLTLSRILSDGLDLRLAWRPA